MPYSYNASSARELCVQSSRELRLSNSITYYKSNESEYEFNKPYSEETAKLIDLEISTIVEKQYKRAIQILKKHKKKLTELADYLLDKEVIFKDDLERIFGTRPFKEKLDSQ